MLSQKGLSQQVASLTAIRPTGSKPPLYFVHAGDGEVLFFANLARHLSQEYPFYALRAQGLDRNTTALTQVDEMATLYLKEIQAFQPTGPYFLGGAGDGGIIAWEMTQQLLRQSKSVAVLVLMDPSFSPSTEIAQTTKPSKLTRKITYYLQRPVFYITHRQDAKNYAVYTLRNFAMKLPTASVRRRRLSERTSSAVCDYNLTRCEVRMILFLPERRNCFPDPQTRVRDWHNFVAGHLDTHIVPENTLTYSGNRTFERQLNCCKFISMKRRKP